MVCFLTFGAIVEQFNYYSNIGIKLVIAKY